MVVFAKKEIRVKGFGFLLGPGSTFRAPQIPDNRLNRVNQSLKRRLDDDIEEVFNRAVAGKDAESAGDLLELMEKWHARRQQRYGRERRISGANVQRARLELDRLGAATAVRVMGRGR
jgi:hypothetical protein